MLDVGVMECLPLAPEPAVALLRLERLAQVPQQDLQQMDSACETWLRHTHISTKTHILSPRHVIRPLSVGAHRLLYCLTASPCWGLCPCQGRDSAFDVGVVYMLNAL